MARPDLSLGRVVTVPNLISLFRLACLPVIAWALANRQDRLAFIFILAGWSSDVLDGLCARVLKQESNLGRIIDPVVDKVSVATVVILLAVNYGLPVWLAGVVVGRDVLILIGSALALRRRSQIQKSNVWGKATGVCFFLLIVTHVLRLAPWNHYMVWVTVVLIAVSITVYSVHFLRWVTRPR